MTEYLPGFLSCVHWVNKAQFQYDVDTYDRWVMFAVEDGTFSFGIDGRRGIAEFGDLVVCPPGIAFHRKVESALTFLFFHLEWVDATGRTAGEKVMPELPVGKVSLLDRTRLSSTYALFRKALAADGPHARPWKNHLLQDLWIQYSLEAAKAESLAKAAEEKGGEPSTKGAAPEMQMARAKIEAAALQPFNLRDVAEELRMSPAQLTKKFSKAFGAAPIRYVTALRMEAAKKMLRETGLTLEQISERCGYPNGFYLNRVFVRQTGQTPSQYRKLHRV
jgi:AraC-like DNA-binding protein